MAPTRQWLEKQAQALLAIGIDAPDVQRTIQWLLQRVPPNADPSTWVPTEFDLMEPITPNTIQDARADWYMRAPAKYKRLLDAPEVP